MKAADVVARLSVLEGGRKVVEQTWQVIEQFVVPYRGDFFKTNASENEVEWRRRDIYDDTAVKACRRLAANLHSNLTSPSTLWFNLSFRSEDLKDDQEATEWLEESAKRTYRALQESNFNLEMAEGYTDMCSFATTTLIEEVVNENDWEGINFQAVPQEEIFFEEGADGAVLRIYRRLKYTPLQIVDKFGEAGLPQDIKNRAAASSTCDTKEDVVFCIYQRPNRKDEDTSQMLAPLARPYGFKYVLRRTREMLGEEGGYYEMPAFITRFAKTSGSMWGHGPAHIGLADILTLNEMVYMDQRSIEKAIDPAMMTTENGLMSDIDQEAGGLTVVSDMDGLKPIVTGARFDVSKDRILDLQRSIVEAFFGDQLELKESPAMTATEVERRWQLMQKTLGPTIGRIQSDLLDPLIQRTFNVLLRAGQLPELPSVLMEQESDMDIEYTGPIPRSQKAEQAASIEGWLEGVGALSEIYPDVLDVPDATAATREVGLLRGVPAKLMNSVDEVEQKGDERKEAQAEAQTAAIAEQEGKAMTSMGEGAQAMEAGGLSAPPGSGQGADVVPINQGATP